jgi:hypothetical protein
MVMTGIIAIAWMELGERVLEGETFFYYVALLVTLYLFWTCPKLTEEDVSAIKESCSSWEATFQIFMNSRYLWLLWSCICASRLYFRWLIWSEP